MFIISFSLSDQNKVLYGGLSAHNRWMPVMLMKYCCNIVTHAICCDQKKTAARWANENVFVQERGWPEMYVCVNVFVSIAED